MPQTTPRAKGMARRYFYDHVYIEQDACQIWPFRTMGTKYGAFYVRRERFLVHRLACQAWWGPPPGPTHHAAHGRDRRCESELCFNGAHMEWKLPWGNSADTIRDGTSQSGERSAQALLTAEQVMEMRSLFAAGGVLKKELADRFGVSAPTVSQLISGYTWRDLPLMGAPPPRAVASPARDEVIRLHSAGIPPAEIAARVGLGVHAVHKIMFRVRREAAHNAASRNSEH